MSFTRTRLSSIEPFGFIECPVCGGREFAAVDPGGGVWCDHCNAEFRVRGTSGEPGCVVDALFDTVAGESRTALQEQALFVRPYAASMAEHAGVYEYRVLKFPNVDAGADEDSGWIVSARDLGEATVRNVGGRPLWEYLRRGHCLAIPDEVRWLRGYRGPREIETVGPGGGR
jgi:hypothetical protein